MNHQLIQREHQHITSLSGITPSMPDVGLSRFRDVAIYGAWASCLATAALSLTVISVVLTMAVRLFAHPLARVPGPRLAAVTNLWHAHYAKNGRMFELATTLHKKYGPVVRVGPNEVWLDSAEAFKTIYSKTSGPRVPLSHHVLTSLRSEPWLREVGLLSQVAASARLDCPLMADRQPVATSLQRPRLEWGFPLKVATPDTLDLLSERDMRRYRLQRRLIGPAYRPSNVQRYDSAVDGVIRQAISRIKALGGAEVDLKEWMHIIVVECLGAVVLSWSPGLLRAGSDGGTGAQSYLAWRSKSVLGLFPLLVIAESYSKTLGRLFRILLGVTHQMPKNFKPFFHVRPASSPSSVCVGWTDRLQRVQERIRKRMKAQPTRKHRQDRQQDLMNDLIELKASRPEFSDTHLRRMAMTNFGAGHETMTSALTAALAMIGTHPGVQERVAKEVHDTPEAIAFEDAKRLTYTLACIQEAQRLHPAIGMSLPRKVPIGGLRVDGHFFPPGTTVGCNPVSFHRNRDIFGEDAESFRPDRWLTADEPARKALRQYTLTWGGGPRMCPGRRLAEMVIYKVVPSLLREFNLDVAMPPETDIRYYFVAMLTGVKVRFVPRNEEAHRGEEWKNNSSFGQATSIGS